MRLWVECMIVRPCSQAIVALTFALYVLRAVYTDCDPPEDAKKYLACICIGEYASPPTHILSLVPASVSSLLLSPSCD